MEMTRQEFIAQAVIGGRMVDEAIRAANVIQEKREAPWMNSALVPTKRDEFAIDFAQEQVAKEREACASLVDLYGLCELSAAIRARK